MDFQASVIEQSSNQMSNYFVSRDFSKFQKNRKNQEHIFYIFWSFLYFLIFLNLPGSISEFRSDENSIE